MRDEKNIRRLFNGLERVVERSSVFLWMTLIFFVIFDLLGGFVLEKFSLGKDFLPREIYFHPRPFVGYGGAHERELAKDTDLNSLGYRGPIPIRPKPQSEVRIIIVGGSTVLFGDPTISLLVEQFFHQAGMNQVAVYNFGVAASTIRMDVARVVFEVADYTPDLIVFYGGGNDIIMPFQADPRPGFPPNFLAYEQNPLLLAGTREQSWGTLFKLALFHSQIIRGLLGEPLRRSLVPLQEMRRRVAWNSEEWSDTIARTFLGDVSRAHKVSLGLGAQSVVIFQPILAFKEVRTPSEQSMIEESLLRHAIRCRSMIVGGLQEMSQREALRYVDISSVFDSEQGTVFRDGIHINQEYFSVIAANIFEVINPLLQMGGAKEHL